MLSFEEILKRLIAHLRRRGRFENIDPNLPLSRYLSKEQTRLLIEEVRHLPWIQSGKMQLHQRAPTTLAAMALDLYQSQPQRTRIGSLPKGKARASKKAKKAAKKAVKKAAPKSATRVPRKATKPARPRVYDRGDSQDQASVDPGEPYQMPESSDSGATSSPAPASPPPLPEEATAGDAITRKDLTYSVWFGTNRKPNDASDYGKGFSGSRDSRMHLGVCKVFVPESHMIGSTGSSWWKRLIKGADDRLKLSDIKALAEAEFWADVTLQLQRLRISDREAVIFIHGYNVSFEDAAIRAAQLGTDLSVRGCMAFYSWPSRGKTSLYSNDEATIEASEQYIAQFLTDFAQRSGASKIHIIAHSMGNRGVLRAVNRIATAAARRTGKAFDQIILAAPDVDADTFKQLYEAYGKISRRTTLYASAKDRAVGLSNWLHGYDRVGLTPPVTVLRGIDTVVVTNADVTVLGHGYVAESRGVLTDIHMLIKHGAPPSKRFGLQAQSQGDLKYWLIGA
ncbi:alpha/beta fold hydrolase [Bradyrhizobium diazoefficiens]|uniref:alpha/beta hydrolase n=1 Tax=Bradyrhizobium diazoefficiens TaxID=1355477 RepID=UPI00190D3417|nr:alpha/beta hydrolase [Bradyrhizobium diazoefficiens]QQO16054.1 alpha/beta fold hydrolase [Bradyrhizobium diazoefficiens]